MSAESRHSSASHKHWKLNWWDLWPLVDSDRRPLQWTNSSLILSPHPLSPAVVARHFPSSSSFVLPSPNPVLNNPGGFSPPSIIEASPRDDYVFAFFEGKGIDNVACIWHRGETIDTWKVNINWQIKAGQGIILARWLCDERVWVRGTPPTRSTPLGPVNPFGKTTLLLVTQSHVVQIVHRTSLSFPFQLVSASLRHASQANLTDRSSMGDSTNGPGGLRVCTRAAIGLGYNEPSVIIATFSTLIPPSTTADSEFSDHFNVLGPSTPPAASSPHAPWEDFGPESAIHLCEVKITAYNFIMGISTKPLPPLFPQVIPTSHLTDIHIIPHLQLKEESDESIPLMHVVLAYLDLEDYLSPRSHLLSFELKRNKDLSSESSKSVAWLHRHLQTRTIANTVVSFLLPSQVPGSQSLIAGLLDLEGFIPRSSNGETKSREISVGRVVKLKLPQLDDDEDWEPSRLMAAADDAGTDPPISAVMSPCESFICASPATWSNAPKLGVHPQPREKGTIGPLPSSTLSECLLSTILADRPPTDIVHTLANPTFPLLSVIEVLELTFRTLDCNEFPVQDWHARIGGIVLEVFRVRCKRLSKENPAEASEKASLDERWRVALDVCSVRVLKSAFEACKEDDGYDMDPIWHLIALCTWLVDFSERLVRTCVLWEGGLIVHNARILKDASADKSQDVVVKVEAERDDLFDGDLSPPPDASIYPAAPSLINIIHPYALDNLTGALSHLNMFRAFLDTLTASRLKASIAKDVVVDIIDCSGVDFKELESGLRKIRSLEEFTSLDADVLTRCFCSMLPPASTHELIVKACTMITSPQAVSKPRLFIKPSDLVDGISRLNLATAKMNQERDIVSKGVLGMPAVARKCARCGGRTETGQSPLPRGKETSDFGSWAVWEHEWEKCICGGLWVKELAI